MKEKIILASASPRRKELLKQMGLEFEVLVSEVDENLQGKKPSELVEELAFQKALDVANKVKRGLVIGADTVVVHKDKILGKPCDDQEARTMLRELSGQAHHVITGLAVIDAKEGTQVVTHETTEVFFRQLESKEIEGYIATGEHRDKAGAYAIQGLAAIFVERINGCYFNVVGLPIHKLALTLKDYGISIL